MSTKNSVATLLSLGVLYLLGISWPLIVAAAVLGTVLAVVHERSRPAGNT